MEIFARKPCAFLSTILLLLSCGFWINITAQYRYTVQYACNRDLDSSILAMPFCDTSLPISARVKDLVGRLTLHEKVQQLVNDAPDISRIGIPKHQWWHEALHGVANSPGVTFTGIISGATSFPQPILTAASFNTSLWSLIGEVISTEARAMYNSGQTGLTFWAPNINIFRDPRWGRGQETPGEDPLISSVYAALFVRGMQEIIRTEESAASAAPTPGTDTDVAGAFSNARLPYKPLKAGETMNSVVNVDSYMLKTSVCCKHFTAYDVENWEGNDRYHFDALVSQQDLEDTYNVPFQSCVQEGRASSIMCSYNRLNGIPACANYELLTETVRNTWGLQGYTVSDCDAVQLIYSAIGYAGTGEDAVADVLLAGLDLNCGDTISTYGVSAVQQGKVNESTVDNALSNLFTLRMRLGLFDGDPAVGVFGRLGPADVCSQEHQDLALDAALQGIVLLKNENKVLPFSADSIGSLAVIGPNGNATNSMLGNYAGDACQYVTFLQGIESFVNLVQFQPGCIDTTCEGYDYLIDQAADAAANADVVVIVAGLGQAQEQESVDRTSLKLPGQQERLIITVANVSVAPIVLVIMSGGPVDVTFAKNDNRIAGIIWVGLPGQAGGQALAEILFGRRNPGGRLPMTWYPQEFTEVSMTDMNMRPNDTSKYPGRTYRFYQGQSVYSFGDGLSYTTFTHNFVSAPTSVFIPDTQQQDCFHNPRSSSDCSTPEPETITCESTEFTVRIAVRNEGTVSGSNVILLYTVPTSPGVDGAPLKQLIAFKRVAVDPSVYTEVAFQIQPCMHLSLVTVDGRRTMQEGLHTLVIGNNVDPQSVHTLQLVIKDPDASRDLAYP